jgi:hypothetical protein
MTRAQFKRMVSRRSAGTERNAMEIQRDRDRVAREALGIRRQVHHLSSLDLLPSLRAATRAAAEACQR